MSEGDLPDRKWEEDPADRFWKGLLFGTFLSLMFWALLTLTLLVVP